MGELSEEERRGVEENLSRFPELHGELRAIEDAQENFLQRSAINPAPQVRERVLEKIAQQQQEVKVIPIERSSVALWRFAAAAAASIAIVSSILAYTYWRNWQESDARVASILSASQSMATNYNQVNRRLDKLESDLLIIENPQFERVVMTGTANAPQSLASVYWNSSSKEVFLRIQSLKELSAENQYQLWAIIDGKPVDAGVFDAGDDGLIKMKDIAGKAATFAVTIEPRGGKPSPTLESMQVAGNVTRG